MIGKKTLESEPIPAAKVKEILEDFSEKHELSYEQNLSLAHATSLNKLSLEHTEKLIEELEAYMTHKQAIRVADIIPRDMADLRLIFAKERNAPSNDEMKEILEIIEKYEIYIEEGITTPDEEIEGGITTSEEEIEGGITTSQEDNDEDTTPSEEEIEGGITTSKED